MYSGIIQTAAVACVLAVAFAFAFETKSGRRLVVAFDAFAERRAIAIIACSVLALVGSALVAVLVRWPEPAVHDEFSYLLAADTFASGRLSNPAHEHWQHFETFYVLHQPSYASRFPPAQGLILALGTVLGGSPVLGLWLSAAAMAGAICWALYGFVSARWALLGGLVAVCQIGITTYWTQSFWGGALSAAAGALVFGSTVRLLDAATVRDAVMLSAGLLLLANTRPFEGAVLVAAPACFVLAALLGRRLAMRSLVPAIVLGLVSLVSQYAERPVLSLQENVEAKSYRHDVLRDFFHHEDPQAGGMDHARVEGEGWELFTELCRRLERLRGFLVGRLLFLPLIIGCVVCWRFRAGRLAMSGLVAAAAALWCVGDSAPGASRCRGW